jgi:hypothetical protein
MRRSTTPFWRGSSTRFWFPPLETPETGLREDMMTSRTLTPLATLAVAMTLVPCVGLAQTARVAAPSAGVLSGAQCRCPSAPPPMRRALPAPPREIGVKIAALLPLTGPSFSYARNLNDSVALEGAFDVVSLSEWQPAVGLALAQVRFSENAGFASERFVTAGIARATQLGGRRDWLGVNGFGLAVGGGRQHLLSDRAGMRFELQFIRFEQAPMLRATLGAFVGIGD